MHWLPARSFCALAAAIGVAQPAAADQIGAAGRFVDDSLFAGLDQPNWDGYVPPMYLLTPMREYLHVVGGASAGDFDNDGWPDLFVPRVHLPNLLYHNQRDGRFAEIGAGAGVAVTARCCAAAWGDVDNDGWLDLYVVTLDPPGVNYLYVNQRDGTFDEQAQARGADLAGGDRYYSGAAFGDYDLDGDLDLLVLSWRRRSKLLQNDGAGFFTVVNGAANLGLSHSRAFAGGFADVNSDGWPDVLAAGDFGTSELCLNQGDGTFRRVTQAAGVGTDENGMGSAIGDPDNDGDLDWFVTAIFDPNQTCADDPSCGFGWTGNRFYRNDGGAAFDDATDELGVRDGRWGWGASFFDYDNDGDLDLAQAAGIRLGYIAGDDPFNDDPLRLWRNDGAGAWPDVAAELDFVNPGSGKGIVVFDYDRDGDLDVLVVNNLDPPRLLRYDGAAGPAWLQVALRGRVTNRFGIGARIHVRANPDGPTQMREVSANSNYMSQNDVVEHFGLDGGVSRLHWLAIEWPASGVWQEYFDTPVNQRLTIHETLCPGDVDEDGRVALADLETLLLHFGAAGVGPEAGDLDGDEAVGIRDLALLLNHFGAVCD